MDIEGLFRRGVGEGRELERLWVVSPYVADGFFAEIVRLLKPRKVYLTVDETTSASSVEAVRSAIGTKRLANICYATSPGGGLVHAKLYCLRWGGTKVGGSKLWTLFWGSANATDGGFGKNAETLSWTRVTTSGNAEMFAYFDALTRKRGAVEEVMVPLGTGGTLLLPAFSFSPNATSSDLDAWIQRGVLFHEFREDQTFLRFSIKLKRPLPAGAAQKLLTLQGFAPDGDPKAITRRYIPLEELDAAKSEKNWKSRYFIDTTLGLWTSAEAYKVHKKKFVKSSTPRRERALQTFDAATAGDIEGWISEFIDALRHFADQLVSGGVAVPSDHLEYKDGAVHEAHYRNRARKQVSNDERKAKDAWFRLRFTSGYQQADVPRFRTDAAAWRSFTTSWGQALESEIERPRSQSALAKAIRALPAVANDEVDDVVDWLRERENWDQAKAKVKAFHKQ